MDTYRQLIRTALEEDKASEDVTTLALVPASTRISARLVSKKTGIICGMALFSAVFEELDPRCRINAFAADGDAVAAGTLLAEVRGPARAILSGERTALNFIQHLSGIATLTGLYVNRVRGTDARILDTRKTIPGFRDLAKYAVRCGGGENHRRDLSSMALIKDNHLGIASIADAVRRVRRCSPGVPVEVECDTLAQVRLALAAGADIIMLDNMPMPRLKECIKLIRRRKAHPLIEISGGVTLSTVRAFARLGVERISVGALTHSAPALDLSLEIQ